jgi:hypothetical protein
VVLHWETHPTNTLEPVLKPLGFRFDPFSYFEASGDPHLGEYIVGHDMFAAVAWNDAPAFIFAPAGGGKTTMRIYTARSCWIPFGGAHPFPLVFTPANHNEWPAPHNLLNQLTTDGAAALLIGLAFRPERYLALAPVDQQSVATFLRMALPGQLDFYLNVLRQRGTPLALPPLLDRAYVLPNPPDPQGLIQFCDAVLAAPTIRSAVPTSAEFFDQFIQCLQEILNFGSVLVLVDGVDALPETSSDPAKVIEWLRPLLMMVPAWAKRRIYVKGFLSEETQFPLQQQLGELWPTVRHAHLAWTPGLLAELIRRRIYSATQGKFGSLDAFSSSELRDVETTIVKLAPPNPREVIILARRVLFEYARRMNQNHHQQADQLQQSDLDAAVAWYRLNAPANIAVLE